MTTFEVLSIFYITVGLCIYIIDKFKHISLIFTWFFVMLIKSFDIIITHIINYFNAKNN
jgi:hypothetical protein